MRRAARPPLKSRRKLAMVKRTVDFHIDNARLKLGAATRTEAAIKAAAGGLIKP
jgi:DNA-binding NarL/FixJ family response regulator